MGRNRIIEGIEYTAEELDYSKWPKVLIEEGNEVIKNRKKAVELYLDQEITLKEIQVETGIGRNEIIKYVRKCLSRDDNGVLWGFRALVPYKRIGKKYDRISPIDGMNPGKLTGAFNSFMEMYPDIRETITNYFLNRSYRSVADRIIKISDLHKKFLIACKSKGILLNEYPFTTKDRGKRSLYRFILNLELSYIDESSRRYGDDAVRQMKLTSHDNYELIVKPYELVELDGHKIDALITVKFKNLHGDETTEVMQRIWLLLIIDVATRAILGYHLCLNSEYSSSDVLHCIKKSIVPWKPKDLTIPGLKYPDDIGYPHAKIPETNWAVWDQIKMDNAKAHHADIVSKKLTDIVRCHINYGPVQFPERRGIIERFFGLLEERSIHRLGNTTGSNPNDPRRKNAEKIAKKYEITADELEQILEVVIAQYNTEPHSFLGISPLDAMQQRIQYRDMQPRLLEEEKKDELKFFSMKITRTVRGSLSKRRRPHINYLGAEYTSSLLERNFSLIGKEIILEVDTEDISVIKAYLSTGEELDYLRAKGKWGSRPHSLRIRQHILKLANDREIFISERDDPIEIYERYLMEKSEKNKKPRNQLAKVQDYNKKMNEKHSKEIEESIEMHTNTIENSENENLDSKLYWYKDPKEEISEEIESKLKTNC